MSELMHSDDISDHVAKQKMRSEWINARHKDGNLNSSNEYPKERGGHFYIQKYIFRCLKGLYKT